MSIAEKRITKIIDGFREDTLDKLATICQYGNGINCVEKNVTKIYTKSYPQLEQSSSIFLGKFVENLFYAYYCIKQKKEKKKYIDIENIITSKHIVTNVPTILAEWFYINKLRLTWEYYDNIKSSLDPALCDILEKKMSRSNELNTYTIMNDGYFKAFIFNHIDKIKCNYEKYLTCQSYDKIKKYLFQIICLIYALETQHYFHVTNNGKKFKYILTQYDDIFNELHTHVMTMDTIYTDHNVGVSKWDFIGEIDLLENDNIWEIKCVSEITLKHVLQVLMYNIMYNSSIMTLDTTTINLNFINVLRGNITIIKMQLSRQNIMAIIEIFITESTKQCKHE
jgi:hypothetical protein